MCHAETQGETNLPMAWSSPDTVKLLEPKKIIPELEMIREIHGLQEAFADYVHQASQAELERAPLWVLEELHRRGFPFARISLAQNEAGAQVIKVHAQAGWKLGYLQTHGSISPSPVLQRLALLKAGKALMKNVWPRV